MFLDKVMGVLQVFYAFMCYLLFINGTFIYMNCFCTEDTCKNFKKNLKRVVKFKTNGFLMQNLNYFYIKSSKKY